MKALKKSDDKSMSDFVIKVSALTDSLLATGDRLRDVDIIDFVVDGLGPKFQPFISSIHSQPNMLFDDFLHLVIKEDFFLKKLTSNSPASTTLAFVAKKSMRSRPYQHNNDSNREIIQDGRNLHLLM